MYDDDYKKAGFKLLPNNGEKNMKTAVKSFKFCAAKIDLCPNSHSGLSSSNAFLNFKGG